MATKKSTTAAGRKIANKKAAKREVLDQHLAKKIAVAKMLTAAVTKSKKGSR